MKKTKYFYYFRGDLTTHVHFFLALQNVCEKENINLELITFLKPNVYLKQISLVRKFKSESFKIITSPIPLIVPIIYFLFVILFSKKTIIHLKKRDPNSLFILKKIFKNKLILITDLEGDLISEKEYLLLCESRDKNIIHKNIESSIQKEKTSLSKYDLLFVQNNYFKNLLQERHLALKANIKISHLMSFKKGNLFYDKKSRNEFRLKLGWQSSYIITYIGNVFYPWQNLSKTIRIYKNISKNLSKSTKLLLLIRKADHSIAKEIIDKHNLNKDDYYLQEVPHSDIRAYLSASDLGVVIRDFHTMNKVVTSGKLLDYLGSGLPVITTSVLDKIPNFLKKHKYGIVLENLDLEMLEYDEIREILNTDNHNREKISMWANNNLSLEVTAQSYIKTLKSFNL